METEELQDEIRNLISALGWKLPKLAEVLYVERHDDDVYDEDRAIKAFYEKLKGHLKRSTTSSELLKKYLEIIAQHPDSKKNDIVIPQFHQTKILSESMVLGMRSISKNIMQEIDYD